MRIFPSIFAAILLICLAQGCGLKGPLKKPEPATPAKLHSAEIKQPAPRAI